MEAKDKERLFAESTLVVLKDYLLSSTLFWPLSLGGLNNEEMATIPKLTPGNLYLCLRKINAYHFKPDATKELKELETRILVTLEQWQSNWRKKAELEFPKRIKMWESYLRDLKRNKSLNTGSFSYHIRNRVILDLLDEELKVAKNEEILTIRFLDDNLKNLVTDGDFLWEMDLIQGFPQNPYWYLYIKT